MKLFVRVFHNGDHAGLVWGPTDPHAAMDGCLGFAIQRRKILNGATQEETLVNYSSFDIEHQKTRFAPSDQWPVQAFHWWDYAPADSESGAQVSYRVTPISAAPAAAGATPVLQPMAGSWPDWTEPVALSGDCGEGISCYFNRGVVASQWVARAMVAKEKAGGDSMGAELEKAIETKDDPLRAELSGVLRRKLLGLLDDANKNGETIYLALYELNDKEPELLPMLRQFGPRANLILANGAFNPPAKPDENKVARALLNGDPPDQRVTVIDRMVPSGHFGHNKFVVFCKDGQPQRVWTGSTNWAPTGLCTQANNGILFDNPEMAQCYMKEWNLLKEVEDDIKAGKSTDHFPKKLKDANTQQKTFTLSGGTKTTVWFVPTNGHADMHHARQLIQNAKDGALFLMFEPGGYEDDPEKWTLLQSILYRHQQQAADQSSNPGYDPQFYIRGVLNQEIAGLTEAEKESKRKLVGGKPEGSAEAPATALISTHPERRLPADITIDVVAPAGEIDAAGFIEKTQNNSGVKIHSKVIVLDPFGDHPVVMTGSHNMGCKASEMNDDNLVIIEGNAALAQAYAANIISVYQQYRANMGKAEDRELKNPWERQADWFTQDELKEDMAFWLKVVGAPPAAVAAVTAAASGAPGGAGAAD